MFASAHLHGSYLWWEVLPAGGSKGKIKPLRLRNTSTAYVRERQRSQRVDSPQNEWRKTRAQATEVMLSIKFNRRTWKYYCWQSSSVLSKPIYFKRAVYPVKMSVIILGAHAACCVFALSLPLSFFLRFSRPRWHVDLPVIMSFVSVHPVIIFLISPHPHGGAVIGWLKAFQTT